MSVFNPRKSIFSIPTVSTGFIANWVTTISAATASVMTADTDVSKLEERLLTLDTVWRFLAAKKLDYAEAFNKAEGAIQDAITRDGPKPRLELGGNGTDIQPVVVIPAGSWGS